MGEWVVRSAGLVRRKAPLKDYDEFVCEVENRDGCKAKFSLTPNKSTDDSDNHTQTYALLSPYLRVGALISFGSAYIRDRESFSLGFYDLLPLTPYRVNGGVISADEFLNSNRGYWAYSQHHGKRIPFPCGLLRCWGDVHIPLVESGHLPHMLPAHMTGGYREGLRYGRRRSGIEELFLELFPRKRSSTPQRV